MTDEIKILAIEIVDKPPWPGGDKLIAHFDCEFRGIRLKHAQLIRGGSGKIIVCAAKTENRQTGERIVQLLCPVLRAQLADAAMEKYELMSK